MNSNDIQELLDGLDRRLALGDIDLESYNRLRSKFLSEMQETVPENILRENVENLPREVQKLNCPNCGAPVNAFDRTQSSVQCEFCGISYALKTAEDEMERLRSDLKRWLRDISDSDGRSISSIDKVSRNYIFKEKIFPLIDLDVNRTIELFEISKHQAILNLPVARIIQSAPFYKTYSIIPSYDNFRDKISEILIRVQSSEVNQFAIQPDDCMKLGMVEVKCQEIIHLHNIRKHLYRCEKDSIRIAINNLEALESLYESKLNDLSEMAHADQKFYSCMKRRMSLLSIVLQYLDGLMNQSVIDLCQLVKYLNKISYDLQAVIDDLNSSGKELKNVIPVVEGIRSDIGVIKIFQRTVGLYRRCLGDDSRYFEYFISEMESLTGSLSQSQSDINWLLDFMTLLLQHLDAVHSNGEVMVNLSFKWENEVVSQNIKSSLFGGKEEASIESRYLIPFWIASISFSRQKGLIFKKGFADQGYLILPASNHKSYPSKIEDESMMYDQCQVAHDRRSCIGTKVLSLCPLVDERSAMKKMKYFQDQNEEYRSSYLNMIGLVYLPMVVAKFVRKGERRMILFSDEGVSLESINVKNHKIGNLTFFAG